MRTDTILQVTDPAAWKLLMSPVRVEIAEGLRCIGPCSVAELAELIDRPADTLYRHIELLTKAGLVCEAGFRKSGRNNEVLIDVVAEDFQPAFSGSSGQGESDAILTMTRTFLRGADHAVRDSIEAQTIDYSAGPGRNFAINYELGWLTPAAFEQIRTHIRAIKKIMDEGKRKREGSLFVSLMLAAPVTRKRSEADRRRRAGTSPARTTGHGKPKPEKKTKSPPLGGRITKGASK